MNSKLKKVAVILSGCGRADGSEIQEAVSILINLSKNKLQMNYYAPNKMQMHVIDHQTGKELEDENQKLRDKIGSTSGGGGHTDNDDSLASSAIHTGQTTPTRPMTNNSSIPTTTTTND